MHYRINTPFNTIHYSYLHFPAWTENSLNIMGSVVPTNDTQYCSSCWNLGFSFALLT